jgi:hypothetical protein
MLELQSFSIRFVTDSMGHVRDSGLDMCCDSSSSNLKARE